MLVYKQFEVEQIWGVKMKSLHGNEVGMVWTSLIAIAAVCLIREK